MVLFLRTTKEKTIHAEQQTDIGSCAWFGAIADFPTRGQFGETGDQAERAVHAANVIRQLVNTPESNIPKELFQRAHAIAVIPNVIKAAFGVGGLHGKGFGGQANP